MKICFFTTSFAEHKQSRLEYAEKYFPEDVEIFLITPKSQNKYALSRTKVLEFSENKLLFVLSLRKFCKENKITLLTNLGTPLESFALLFSTLFTPTRFVINIHSNLLESYKLENSLFKRIASLLKSRFVFIPFLFADTIIFGASDQTKLVSETFSSVEEKIKCLPLILDEKLFHNKGKIQSRRKLNLPLDKKIIIFVGRIDTLKGAEIILDLISSEMDKFFILIGSDKKNLLSNLNSKNWLHLDKITPTDLPAYYSASDLSILPSKTEGFGLVSRESLLCETPAIVSNITSLKSIPGVIISENTFVDMAEKIKLFFDLSSEKQAVIGKKGRSLIIKETSFSNLKQKYLDLFYIPYK